MISYLSFFGHKKQPTLESSPQRILPQKTCLSFFWCSKKEAGPGLWNDGWFTQVWSGGLRLGTPKAGGNQWCCWHWMSVATHFLGVAYWTKHFEKVFCLEVPHVFQDFWPENTWNVVFTQVPLSRSVSLAEPKLLCRVPSGFCRMKTGPKVSTVWHINFLGLKHQLSRCETSTF